MSMMLQPATGSDLQMPNDWSRRRQQATTPRGSASSAPSTRVCAAYASQHVGSDAADDVVSETMMRAVTSIDRFRWTPAGIEPWLFGIARRVVADHHRRTGRLRRWSRAVASPAPSLPADAVELADEHAAVRAAFSQPVRPRP